MADLPDWSSSSSASYTTLYSGPANGLTASGLDTTGYQSLQVLIGNLNGATPLVCSYTFQDSKSTFVIDVGTLSADASALDLQWPCWTIPVVADKFFLQTANANLVAVVIGCTEKLPKRMNSDLYPGRQMFATIPASTPASTETQLTDSGTFGTFDTAFKSLTGYNGPITIVMNSSQAISGQVQFGFKRHDGSRALYAVGDSLAPAVQRVTIGHPFAYVSWWYITGAVSPASSTAISVIIFPATPML